MTTTDEAMRVWKAAREIYMETTNPFPVAGDIAAARVIEAALTAERDRLLAERRDVAEAVELICDLTDRLEHANGFITARTGARSAARTEALNEAHAFLARQEADHG